MELKAAAAAIAGLKLRAAGIRGLRSAGFRGVQDIVGRIIPSRSPQPVDRAIYRAAWRVVDIDGGVAIENLSPHAVFIEEGVRAGNVKAGRAMIDALAAWAQRKGLATSGDAVKIAWAIAMSMKRRGIFGPRGLGILRELVNDRIDGFIREEVVREVEKELKGLVK